MTKKNVIAFCVLALIQQCCSGQVGGGGGPASRAPGGPPVTTAGTVFDPSGAPVPYAGITIWRTSRPISVTNADADGKYSIQWHAPVAPANAAPAASVLMVRDPVHNLVAARDLKDTDIHVDLHLVEGLDLSGSVQDPAGNPLTNLQVRLTVPIGNWYCALDQAMTDAQGSFRFRALLPEREYTMSVNIPGPGSSVSTGGYGSRNGTLAAKDTLTNRYAFPAFVLSKADRKIAGYVLDGSNQPLAAVSLNISGAGQPTMLKVTTDEKGHFALDGVCDGLLTMSFLDRGKPRGIPPSVVYLSAVNGQGIRAGDTNLVLMLGDKQPDANAH